MSSVESSPDTLRKRSVVKHVRLKVAATLATVVCGGVVGDVPSRVYRALEGEVPSAPADSEAARLLKSIQPDGTETRPFYLPVPPSTQPEEARIVEGQFANSSAHVEKDRWLEQEVSERAQRLKRQRQVVYNGPNPPGEARARTIQVTKLHEIAGDVDIPVAISQALEQEVWAEAEIDAFFYRRLNGAEGYPDYDFGWAATSEFADWRREADGQPRGMPDTLWELTFEELEHLDYLLSLRNEAKLQARLAADLLYGPLAVPHQVEGYPVIQAPAFGTRLETAMSRSREYWAKRGYEKPCAGDAKYFVTNIDNPVASAWNQEATGKGAHPCEIFIEAGTLQNPDADLTHTLKHEDGHGFEFCHVRDQDHLMWGPLDKDDPYCRQPDPDWR